jgi:hypothetical protein
MLIRWSPETLARNARYEAASRQAKAASEARIAADAEVCRVLRLRTQISSSVHRSGDASVPAPAERDAIHECLRLLASHDEDCATLENGVGFNKSDSCVGRFIADAAAPLPDDYAIEGRRLVHRYQRQIPADLFAAAVGDTTKASTTRRPKVKAPGYAAAPVVDTVSAADRLRRRAAEMVEAPKRFPDHYDVPGINVPYTAEQQQEMAAFLLARGAVAAVVAPKAPARPLPTHVAPAVKRSPSQHAVTAPTTVDLLAGAPPAHRMDNIIVPGIPMVDAWAPQPEATIEPDAALQPDAAIEPEAASAPVAPIEPEATLALVGARRRGRWLHRTEDAPEPEAAPVPVAPIEPEASPAAVLVHAETLSLVGAHRRRGWLHQVEDAHQTDDAHQPEAALRVDAADLSDDDFFHASAAEDFEYMASIEGSAAGVGSVASADPSGGIVSDPAAASTVQPALTHDEQDAIMDAMDRADRLGAPPGSTVYITPRRGRPLAPDGGRDTRPSAVFLRPRGAGSRCQPGSPH